MIRPSSLLNTNGLVLPLYQAGSSRLYKDWHFKMRQLDEAITGVSHCTHEELWC